MESESLSESARPTSPKYVCRKGFYTIDGAMTFSLSDTNAIEKLLSFQIAVLSGRGKYVMFSRLCKYHHQV